MDYHVVRTEETVKRVHLSEISVLLIESTAVSMTAYLLCELSKRKVVVLNLKSYLTVEEQQLFYKNAVYEKYNLLLIENFQHGNFTNYEKIVVVDKDLCII